MSSLLRPVVIETCQTSLRSRRRSSINPLAAVPRLLASNSSDVEGSAISDEPNKTSEVALGVDCAPKPAIPRLSPLLNAHMPDYASKITVPRHHDTLPTLEMYEISSPSSTSPPTAIESRKASFLDFHEGTTTLSPKLERMRWRLASGFFAYFMCGWGDGVTGTVLPYFMSEFNLSFMTSSLLFAGSTCGFIVGTLLVESIMKMLGRVCLTHLQRSLVPALFRGSGKTHEGTSFSALQARHVGLLISSVLHGVFFVIMGTRGGFAVLFLAYVVAAFARSILTETSPPAALNEYFVSAREEALGYAFGLWSFGGVASPLVCQAIIATGVPWFKFYYGSLVLSAINVVFLVITFRPTIGEFTKERQILLTEAREAAGMETASVPSSPRSESGSTSKPAPAVDVPPPRNTLRLALSMAYQWAFSIFALLYCGCETTTQGFMVTYLLGTRHANPKTAGYVTSGFWGGITVGRFVWGYFTPSLVLFDCSLIRIDELSHSDLHLPKENISFKHALVGVILIMQILVWLINSIFANALFASIIGLMCGPVFPACLAIANAILPAEVHMVSMALISAYASFGSGWFLVASSK
ncbi:major facilitator superfamily domain-containing protein [Crucibulum laeve]|uniref:Major facilitator superfamily domain-containing protein n=1 Tax=Crucibulum laeve TaxID=68775 RepID=A0A5C3M919_9AGAR|nr:major facilitator superfamily domain-containing protein [Crucibulum laeve]